jgi:hypothetical protein
MLSQLPVSGQFKPAGDLKIMNLTPRRTWTKPEIVGTAGAKDAKNGAASNTIDQIHPISSQFDPNYS